MQNSPTPRTHLPSVLQFAFSGLVLAGALTTSAALLLAGLMALGREGPDQAASIFTLAAVSLLVGLLAAPGGVLALLRLLGRPAAPRWPLRLPAARLANAALVVWVLLVLASLGLERAPGIVWLLSPPLLVLAIGIPIWWVFENGRRGLPVLGPSRDGSAQRAWGLLSLALVATPAVIMLVELLVMAGVVVLAVVWLETQTGLANELFGILNQMRAAGDPEQALQSLLPVLTRPGVLTFGLGLGAVVLPLVEELLKPLPLLLWAGRLRPAEGFTGGLLCGAAFALVESLGFSTSAAADGVAGIALARLGTGLLHGVCSALAGWGLASAWTRQPGTYGGPARGFLAFLLAFVLHGAWNLFGLLLGISGLPGGLEALPPVLQRLGQAAPLALIVLAAALLAILLGGNRLLAGETNIRYPERSEPSRGERSEPSRGERSEGSQSIE